MAFSMVTRGCCNKSCKNTDKTRSKHLKDTIWDGMSCDIIFPVKIRAFIKQAFIHFMMFVVRRNTRRVRDLWWQGVPPSVRGKVWCLAIGNELNITPGEHDSCCTFHICLFLIICGHLAQCNISLMNHTNTDCVQMNCVDTEAAVVFVTTVVFCVF